MPRRGKWEGTVHLVDQLRRTFTARPKPMHDKHVRIFWSFQKKCQRYWCENNEDKLNFGEIVVKTVSDFNENYLHLNYDTTCRMLFKARDFYEVIIDEDEARI